MDASRSATVVIGDTHRDIEGAHHHGVRVIGLVTPKHSAAELAQADAVAETATEVLQALRRFGLAG